MVNACRDRRTPPQSILQNLSSSTSSQGSSSSSRTASMNSFLRITQFRSLSRALKRERIIFWSMSSILSWLFASSLLRNSMAFSSNQFCRILSRSFRRLRSATDTHRWPWRWASAWSSSRRSSSWSAGAAGDASATGCPTAPGCCNRGALADSGDRGLGFTPKGGRASSGSAGGASGGLSRSIAGVPRPPAPGDGGLVLSVDDIACPTSGSASMPATLELRRAGGS
mmetsp:Transcript_48626/g.137468  ORF Transcript_48626/g.137468 Transcript_48626/m.137468 type:complete len:226 (+) Transcript_48626:796-1473(+)